MTRAVLRVVALLRSLAPGFSVGAALPLVTLLAMGGAACGPTDPAGTGDCAAGQDSCGGACVDTETNADHCGGCGIACGDGEQCVAGSCSGGGPGTCDPGAVESCYQGPSGTEGVGPCQAGTRTCNAAGT